MTPGRKTWMIALCVALLLLAAIAGPGALLADLEPLWVLVAAMALAFGAAVIPQESRTKQTPWMLLVRGPRPPPVR